MGQAKKWHRTSPLIPHQLEFSCLTILNKISCEMWSSFVPRKNKNKFLINWQQSARRLKKHYHKRLINSTTLRLGKDKIECTTLDNEKMLNYINDKCKLSHNQILFNNLWFIRSLKICQVLIDIQNGRILIYCWWVCKSLHIVKFGICS